MERELLSVVVTTFNSAGTLDACLRGVSWADEIVVLDSGSTDATAAIAAHYGARIHTQPFAGYSAQKQAAIDLASHRWVLLLDSDESLDADAATRLQQALLAPTHAGYQLWRREWQFWRWQSRRGRLNHYVRLFDRQRARMSGHEVHEEVQVDGPTLRVKRELEGGWFQWIAMPLPSVITIQSGINQLRYATLKGIMAAKKKESRVVPAPAASAPKQRITSVYMPEKAKQTRMIGGSPAEAARELVRALREDARVF